MKYVFANTTAQKAKKVKSSCKYPGSGKKWTKLILNMKIHEKYTGY
jgi:hypothetical protein